MVKAWGLLTVEELFVSSLRHLHPGHGPRIENFGFHDGGFHEELIANARAFP